MNFSINSSISSLITHLPGVFFQHAKHPRQCEIFFFARKIFSTSAPASFAPNKNSRTIKSVLLFSAFGLLLYTVIFICPPLQNYIAYFSLVFQYLNIKNCFVKVKLLLKILFLKYFYIAKEN